MPEAAERAKLFRKCKSGANFLDLVQNIVKRLYPRYMVAYLMQFTVMRCRCQIRSIRRDRRYSNESFSPESEEIRKVKKVRMPRYSVAFSLRRFPESSLNIIFGITVLDCPHILSAWTNMYNCWCSLCIRRCGGIVAKN